MIILISLRQDLRLPAMDKDVFGFADAIQVDHLSDEQLKIVEDIFKDFK